jgi:hypothetical protein
VKIKRYAVICVFLKEEENITAKAIEYGQSPEEFEKSVTNKAIDPLAILFGDEEPPSGKDTEAKTLTMPSLFENDYTYLNAAIDHLRHSGGIQAACYPNEKRIDLTAPDDLKQRFRFLPVELWPENGSFILSADKEIIQKEIKRSRKDEKAWPRIHYLWHLNPIVEWANDKVLAAFGRHQSPVLELQGALNSDEVIFILSGLIPNLKSHPLIHRWFGVTFNNGGFSDIEEFESLINRTGLGKKDFPNKDSNIEMVALQQMLPEAIEQAKLWMSNERKKFENQINLKLNDQLEALEKLRGKQLIQLELKFEGSKLSKRMVRSRKEKKRREIDIIFDEYMDWVEDTMTTEDKPYIQVIAVLKGIN